MDILEYEKEIKRLEFELYVEKRKYYFEKLISTAWFFGEYEKFKIKTNKMIVSEYTGGSSCDYRNYKLYICDKDNFKIAWNVSEISISLFNTIISELYENEDDCSDFENFLKLLIENER